MFSEIGRECDECNELHDSLKSYTDELARQMVIAYNHNSDIDRNSASRAIDRIISQLREKFSERQVADAIESARRISRRVV